jgi:hypothetical protein
MWNSGYRREQSNDVFQESPCLRASSGLLMPPSSWNIDARRNSTASTLSSLGPATPVYGRNPFSDSNYVGVTAIDECHDESMDALAMGFAFKAPGSGSASFESWSDLAHSNTLDQPLPLSMHGSFGSHQSLAQAHMATFSGVDSSGPSCATSFASLPYTSFHGHVQGQDNVNHGESLQTLWPYQYTVEHMIAAPTMAPSESLLGGEYICVDTRDQDADLGAYDDADVPLGPSPQDVVLKCEDSEMSEDERQVRRSIHVSPTGGKTVSREQRARVSRKVSKRSGSKRFPVVRVGAINLELENLHDVEQHPQTKRWQRKGKSTSGGPHYCGMVENGKPCGKKFRRQEHLGRHQRTHSGNKPFGCQICPKLFNRNDNCWEHYWTHVHRPGKKQGRNKKFSLRRVLTYISDPKHIEKLMTKWFNELQYTYDAERDPQVQEDPPLEDDNDEDHDIPECSMSPVIKQENYTFRCKV